MKEIKFRGIHDTEFIYGDLQRDNEGNFHITEHTEEGLTFDVKKETVGQYTGLKDKNGIEMYEGDIVEIEHDERWGVTTSIFKITTDVRLWGYVFDWGLIKGYLCSTHILENDYSNVKVIGSIYENPELLEAK